MLPRNSGYGAGNSKESGQRGLWSETLKKARRHWSADAKIKLLRLYFIEKQTISKIWEEASLSPTQFYAWQEQLFTSGSAVLVSRRVPKCVRYSKLAHL
jgi:transposase-like protein